MTFGEALAHLKKETKKRDHGNFGVTRENWYGSQAQPIVYLQLPDEDSFMTEPYLYMKKFSATGKQIRFPLDLSCESILAEDWKIVI